MNRLKLILRHGSWVSVAATFAAALAASATTLFAGHPALIGWIGVAAASLAGASKPIQDLVNELLLGVDPDAPPPK